MKYYYMMPIKKTHLKQIIKREQQTFTSTKQIVIIFNHS